MFDIFKSLFIEEERIDNYTVNQIELRKPDDRGFCYTELVCNADALGGTGLWLCAKGCIDFTKLPLAVKQEVIKEGLFSGHVVLIRQCSNGNSFVSSY